MKLGLAKAMLIAAATHKENPALARCYVDGEDFVATNGHLLLWVRAPEHKVSGTASYSVADLKAYVKAKGQTDLVDSQGDFGAFPDWKSLLDQGAPPLKTEWHEAFVEAKGRVEVGFNASYLKKAHDICRRLGFEPFLRATLGGGSGLGITRWVPFHAGDYARVEIIIMPMRID